MDDLVANGFLTVSRGYMERVQRLDPGKLMEAFLSACSELGAQRARVETSRKKLNQNRQRVRALRKRVEQSRGELQKLQQEVDSLDQPLWAVTSSKAWRLADRVNRWRKELLRKHWPK